MATFQCHNRKQVWTSFKTSSVRNNSHFWHIILSGSECFASLAQESWGDAVSISTGHSSLCSSAALRFYSVSHVHCNRPGRKAGGLLPTFQMKKLWTKVTQQNWGEMANISKTADWFQQPQAYRLSLLFTIYSSYLLYEPGTVWVLGRTVDGTDMALSSRSPWFKGVWPGESHSISNLFLCSGSLLFPTWP